MESSERIKAYNQRIIAVLKTNFPDANFDSGLELILDGNPTKIQISSDGHLMIDVKYPKEEKAAKPEQDPTTLRNGVHAIEKSFHYGVHGDGVGCMTYFEIKQDPEMPQIKYRTDTLLRKRIVSEHPELARELCAAAEDILAVLSKGRGQIEGSGSARLEQPRQGSLYPLAPSSD